MKASTGRITFRINQENPRVRKLREAIFELRMSMSGTSAPIAAPMIIKADGANPKRAPTAKALDAPTIACVFPTMMCSFVLLVSFILQYFVDMSIGFLKFPNKIFRLTPETLSPQRLALHTQDSLAEA